MRYPIINGELPRMAAVIEYHVVTELGFVSASFDDKKLAIERMKTFGPRCKLVEVKRSLTDITPKRAASKSIAVAKVADDRGENVIDIPLAIRA